MRFSKISAAALYAALPRAGCVVVVVILMFAASVPACATVKPVIRLTEHAIAEALCKQSMSEKPELLGGKTVDEICAIASVLQPFFDELLAAKRRAVPMASAHVQEQQK